LTLEEESESSTIGIKLRNLIRSLLVIGEKKLPLAAQILTTVLGLFKSITGIDLLPPKAPKTKGRRTSKKGGKGKQDSSRQKHKHGQAKLPKDESSSKRKGDQSIKHKNAMDTKSGKKESSAHLKSVSKNKTSNKAHTHLSTELKTTNSNYRIQRELKEFLSSPPPNLSVKVGKNIRLWIITMTGAKNTIFEGETYRLRVQFPPEYPTVPPSVYFLQPTPRHEHVCKFYCLLCVVSYVFSRSYPSHFDIFCCP
jgi:hypothetical protein